VVPELLEVVSAAGIALTISIRRVPQSAADLDDGSRRGKGEVDARNSFAIATKDDLALWPRETSRAHESKESSLQMRLASRVQQQLAEKACAGSTGTTQAREPCDDFVEGCASHPNRAVDYVLQLGG